MGEGDILAISRAIERPLLAVICGLSIWWGFQLFKLGIIDLQKGSLSVGQWRVRLERVGPGVFFALFGMIGVAVAMTHNFTDKFTGQPAAHTASPGSQVATQDVRTISSLGASDSSLTRKELRALNAVSRPAMNGQEINKDALADEVQRDRPFFLLLRKRLAETIFSHADLDEWERDKNRFEQGQISDQRLNAKLAKISEFLEETN